MKMIKKEIWKALHNRMFTFSIVIGLIISLVNVVENARVVDDITAWLLDVIANEKCFSRSYQGCSLFINWIAVNCSSLGNNLFYYIWPILASMPYGWSYLSDRRTGMFYQLSVRSSVNNYFWAKYVAIFVSGGLVLFVPVFANLMINALICPYYVPQALSSMTPIFDGSFMSEVFYTEPWIHAIVWCMVDFLWGGVAGCICLIAGTKLRHPAMVILFPFAIFIVIDAIISLIQKQGMCNLEISPLKLAAAATVYHNPEWIVFGVIVILFAVTVVAGYCEVTRNELA